jgi:chromosomal replication initiator protein
VDRSGDPRTEPQVNDADILWKSCTEILREQVSDTAWRTSLSGLGPQAFDGQELVLLAPSTWVRERIESRFLGLVSSVVSDVANQQVNVRLEVADPRADPSLLGTGGVSLSDPDRPGAPDDDGFEVGFSRESPDVGSPAEAATATEPRVRPEQTQPATSGPVPQELSVPSSAQGARRNARGADVGSWDASSSAGGIDPRYTFDLWVTGESNRFAHAAALSVAEMPARSYNPLFIHGGAGLGKTHLLHAIGNYVRENFPALQLRYVSTETFLNEFVDAIRNNTMPAFKRRYRECDVLLIDDVQFMEGKDSLQEEFFHTFNHLYGASKQVVITSDRPPKSIATLEDRLRSRFLSGLITDVQPPKLETRLAILHKKAEREPTPFPDEVLNFIATNVKDNIRELEGALVRVSAFASLTRQPLSLDIAEKVLSDIVSVEQPRQITPEMILEATASAFGFTVDELRGASRRRPLVIARQISMYVFREVTDFSYPAIAKKFGDRDHTTVMHAVQKISSLMKEKRQIYDQVTELILTIKGGT